MTITACRQAMSRLLSLLFGMCLITGLAGCAARAGVVAGTSSATDAADVPPTSIAAVTAGPVPVVVTATATLTSTLPTTDTTISLTWWTPEFISPKATQPAGSLLNRYLSEFEQAQHGKVLVNPVPKAKYGKGGLLDLARTAQTIAPSILPDLIVLDTAELEQAAAQGLLQPLDGLLDPELIRTLYPFAQQAGEFDGHLLAVQFVADLDHVAYNRAQISTPPSTWAGVMASKVSYLFPAGNPQPASAAGLAEDVQPVFLSQYLSAGGEIEPATRQLVLADEPLARVLTFYNDAANAGLLPGGALDMTSPTDAWAVYTQGTVSMTVVSARQFLAEQESRPNTGFAPLPGWVGPAAPLARGWALAITTGDPVRQRAAAALIAWLLTPDRAGGWAQASGWLPVVPLSHEQWASTPYHDFLLGQLALAVSHPIGSTYPQTAAQMHKAMLSVLKDHVNPAQAVQVIVGSPPAH